MLPTAPPALAVPVTFTREPRGVLDDHTEWLLTNGLGGYAMGTVSGVPTRRYHGLLVGALAPPGDRRVVLHSIVERLVPTTGDPIEVSSFRFGGADDGIVHPDGCQRLIRFEKDVSCRWIYEAGPVRLVKELRLFRGANAATVRYTVRGAGLWLRPLLALRDMHRLNSGGAPSFSSEPVERGVRVRSSAAEVTLWADVGRFIADRQRWGGFLYTKERERHQDCSEDLASPGYFELRPDPGRDEQTLTLLVAIGRPPQTTFQDEATDRRAAVAGHTDAVFAGIGRRAAHHVHAIAALACAADDFVIAPPGREHATVIAGYPWFGDWGRDTMISLPGLLLTTGRYDIARRVLSTFAAHARDGLIPNCFDERTGEAAYNTVDAPLWYIHAACEYLRTTGDREGFRGPIKVACIGVVGAYLTGAGQGIRVDADGLVVAGDESTQLTWMDAKRDGVTFTPRHGKAVEINALWVHCLIALADAIATDDPARAAEMRALAERAGESFRSTFWNPRRGCCYDALVPGPGGSWSPAAEVRPNQIFAASLEHSPLTIEQRGSVVDAVGRSLLTPMGLRTLEPGDERYRGRYEGSMFDRDAAYHNGTVWPWLIGPYAEAVLRAGSFSPASAAEALAALTPLVAQLDAGCPGQLAEVFDGDEPRRADGCPAQAWSIAEVLRAYALAASCES